MFQWRASFFFLSVPILTDWHFDKIQWISNGKKIRLTKYTRPLSSTRITVKSRGKFLDAESQVLHSPWISNCPDQHPGSGSHWTEAAHNPQPLSRAHTRSGSSQRPPLSPTSHTCVQCGQSVTPFAVELSAGQLVEAGPKPESTCLKSRLDSGLRRAPRRKVHSLLSVYCVTLYHHIVRQLVGN